MAELTFSKFWNANIKPRPIKILMSVNQAGSESQHDSSQIRHEELHSPLRAESHASGLHEHMHGEQHPQPDSLNHSERKDHHFGSHHEAFIKAHDEHPHPSQVPEEPHSPLKEKSVQAREPEAHHQPETEHLVAQQPQEPVPQEVHNDIIEQYNPEPNQMEIEQPDSVARPPAETANPLPLVPQNSIAHKRVYNKKPALVVQREPSQRPKKPTEHRQASAPKAKSEKKSGNNKGLKRAGSQSKSKTAAKTKSDQTGEEPKLQEPTARGKSVEKHKAEKKEENTPRQNKRGNILNNKHQEATNKQEKTDEEVRHKLQKRGKSSLRSASKNKPKADEAKPRRTASKQKEPAHAKAEESKTKEHRHSEEKHHDHKHHDHKHHDHKHPEQKLHETPKQDKHKEGSKSPANKKGAQSRGRKPSASKGKKAIKTK